MNPSMAALVAAADSGDTAAAETLFAAFYTELHRLARRELARGGGASLGATTLLHEAFLNMSERGEPTFPDRARFMGYASRVMRRVIIDFVRRRRAQKRGGEFHITSFDVRNPTHAHAAQVTDAPRLTRLSELLDELGTVDAALAQVVDLRFFCGFTFAEIATMRAVSERTVQRQWERARLYLHRRLQTDSLAE